MIHQNIRYNNLYLIDKNIFVLCEQVQENIAVENNRGTRIIGL